MFDNHIGTELMRIPSDRHRYAEGLGKVLVLDLFRDKALVRLLVPANSILWNIRGPNIVAAHNFPMIHALIVNGSGIGRICVCLCFGTST